MKKDPSSEKVQEEFFNSFSKNFFKRFKDSGDLIGCSESNFTERQSYGLVVASLMDMGKDVVDFVLTEVSIERAVKEEKSNGRVDYLIGYKKWLFLVELKLAFSGLEGRENTQRFGRAWSDKESGVVSQLESINIEDSGNNSHLQKIIQKRGYNNELVKFPILVVVYANYNQTESGISPSDSAMRETIEGMRDFVFQQLKSCKYEALEIVSIPRPHTNKKGGKQHRTTQGVSIMAGAEFPQKPIV